MKIFKSIMFALGITVGLFIGMYLFFILLNYIEGVYGMNAIRYIIVGITFVSIFLLTLNVLFKEKKLGD